MPSTVSKHLSLLSEADLVEVRKDGRWAYYRLPQGAARHASRVKRQGPGACPEGCFAVAGEAVWQCRCQMAQCTVEEPAALPSLKNACERSHGQGRGYFRLHCS